MRKARYRLPGMIRYTKAKVLRRVLLSFAVGKL
jgi:hypothetical protein